MMFRSSHLIVQPLMLLTVSQQVGFYPHPTPCEYRSDILTTKLLGHLGREVGHNWHCLETTLLMHNLTLINIPSD